MTLYDVDKILTEKADIGETFPSSLETINKLFDSDAYNSYQINAIYGKPKVGKTLLAIQESAYLASKGYNVLFLDTEGSIIPMLIKWVPVFEKRFGERKGKIYVESKKSVETLLDYLGYKVALSYKMSDKKKQVGKLEFRVIQNTENKLAKDIEEKKINFIILDSLTSPLRSFTKERQNFPSRADCMAFILRELITAQENYNVGVLITQHAVFDPSNPYDTLAEMAGGIVAHHYCKRLIYIDARSAKELKDYRRLWLVRSENAAAWSNAGVVRIDDTGYHDVLDKDIISNAFTLNERSKLNL